MAIIKRAPNEYNLSHIIYLASICIGAARQIGKVGELSNVQKKGMAVDMLKSLLNTTGIKLDEYDINTIIESTYGSEKAHREKEMLYLNKEEA
jgi:hypothetical protein